MSRGWQGLDETSKSIYRETYFLENETYTEWLDRVVDSYIKDDKEKANRIKYYIRNYYFHPSTPISSNAGTDRGLPISCFTKSVADTKKSIFDNYVEGFNLGAYGGGIGTVWSDVREVGSKVGNTGSSSGIIPFMGITDRSTLAISQGGLRRASEAVYLDMSHPEIEEFIDLRKPTGDVNRRCPNLHHSVVISDEFMKAVIDDLDWDLVSPKDNKVVKTLKARKLWVQLLEVRQTLKGEPYLLFSDTTNKLSPIEYKKENIKVKTSNLCTEITLRTDDIHSGVCCLGSINVEYFDEFKSHIEEIVADCCDYLDAVLQDFIDRTEGLEGFERARAGAIDERSIGLGVMGFHYLLQKRGQPFESSLAKGTNFLVFTKIKEACDKVNSLREPCPMSVRCGTNKRNIHCTAIAPTMSISSLCNNTSSGIEPMVTNAFSKKVKQGTFAVKNRYLEEYILRYASEKQLTTDWIEAQWGSIKANEGSVQHLEWMDKWMKDVFKTAFEIDQRWIIELASDRAPLIDQAQSLNIFIPGGSNVQYISDIHLLAWKRGVKSLYYLRSSSKNRASTTNHTRIAINTEECLACQ